MIRQHKFNFIKLIFIILLETLNNSNAEYYSSIHEMSALVEYEGRLLEHMQKFVSLNEEKLEFLKDRLAELERERDEAISHGPAYFDSPVNQYLLTKHLTVDWARIANLMAHKTGEKSLNRFKTTLNARNVSFEEELKGGLSGILRLQEAYRLKTVDIAKGKLHGVQYKQKLNAHLCYQIGVQALELDKPRLAHSWLTAALSRLHKAIAKTDIDQPLEETDVLKALADAKTKFGDIQGANATFAKMLELRHDSEELARAYQTFLEKHSDEKSVEIDYSLEHPPIPADLKEAEEAVLFKLTCSGYIRRTIAENSALHCGYLTETHPFLLLAPIKVEELNLDPLLVQYYDVLSDTEIEAMKNISSHRVERATVMGNNGSVVSKVRISQFLFVPSSQHKVLQIVDQRVADMTNLDMEYSEDHQFQNYGIGGHYEQHHDYFSNEVLKTENKTWGNRIATVLFYLSDVKQGGGTAFPYLRLHLLPKKGSAVFWHNLHASGDPDFRTLHGGCPIIVGSKWVLNRWIHEYFQDKGRPCELSNDAALKF